VLAKRALAEEVLNGSFIASRLGHDVQLRQVYRAADCTVYNSATAPIGLGCLGKC